ncbi:hypothetical protein BDK51DRAFT_31562, partial [Blyttiomyces helicus]
MPDETTPLIAPPAPPPPRREVVGLIFMAFSALLFSCMSVLVKLAGKSFPSIQVVLVRSVAQFLLGVCGCLYAGVAPWGPPGLHKGWLVARGTAGATGLMLYFFVCINMNLGDGMTIFFTGPAFTAIFAYISLGEPFTVLDGFATASCLTGV